MFDVTEENGYGISRRNFLRFSLAGSLGAAACWSLVPWRKALAQDYKEDKKREGGKTGAEAQLGKTLAGGGKCKAVIMLYLNGGPSHIDTFDPKPGRDTGGPFKTVDCGHGIAISEHLPNIAKQGKHLCILRSVSSKEGSHERARFVLSTGYRPQGPVEFPGLGAIISKEKARGKDFDLPQNVSIGGGGGPGGGILGARYAPFLVGDATRPVDDMSFPPGVDGDRFARRTKLLDQVEQRFKEERDGGKLADTHREVYQKAERLLTSPLAKTFDVNEEKEETKKAYGMGRFGQGVLMARRLVEAGVPFVEVTLGGWDTHQKNFEQVEKLSGELDPAMGTLIGDLADRGLLDSTLVVCGGEFGRTPRIRDGGRDHHPACFSVVMAGGGIGGGRVVGSSDADGNMVKDRPIAVADIHATIAHLAGYDPNKQNESPLGRPIRLVDPKGGINGGETAPIQEALA